MKIRNGFVSNSSSSSFLVVMSAKDYQNILNDLNPLEVAIVEQADSKRGSIGGQDLVMHSHITGNYSTLEGINNSYIIERAKEIADERGVRLEDLFVEYSDHENESDFFDGEINFTGFNTFTDKARKLADDDKAMTYSDYI